VPVLHQCCRIKEEHKSGSPKGWKAARNIAFYELEFSGIPSFERKQLHNRHKSPFKSLVQGLRRT
jgi:hypothetical protein